MSFKSRLVDRTGHSRIFRAVSRWTTKLLNKLSQRSQTAFRCTATRFGAESNPSGIRARRKNGVTYRTGMRLPSPGALAILRGNIEDATTWKFMAGTKESNIVVASEPMCLPKLFPRGESKRRRSTVLSKAKRFSRHSKRASRAYIWRGRWAPDSARFPATTNGGYRYGKGGGEKSERCGSRS